MSDRGDRTPWLALAAVNTSAVIFGCAALFGRLDASPIWIVAARAGFASLALLAIAGMRTIRLPLTIEQLRRIALAAALLAIYWVSFFSSVQMAGVAAATLTFSSFPLFTIGMEALKQRRLPTAIEIGAGIAIICAVELIAGPGAPIMPAGKIGIALGLVSAACFAAFALVSQSLTVQLNPIVISLYQNTFVALLLAPALPFFPGIHTIGAWFALAALGVIGTALAHQFYLFGLNRLSAAVCSAVISTEPVYAIIFAAAVFAELIRPMILLSAALIVGAQVLLLRRAPRAHG